MKVRHKEYGLYGSSSKFNVFALNEIIVGFDVGGMDSDFIQNYDVYISELEAWKDLSEAFKAHNVIVDNYNTVFFEPNTEEDRERGYAL